MIKRFEVFLFFLFHLLTQAKEFFASEFLNIYVQKGFNFL